MASDSQDGNGGGGKWHDELEQSTGKKAARAPPKVVIKTKAMITKHAGKIAKRADEHEEFITKVTYSLGVACFGTFCFLLGSRPDDIPYLYCLFFICVAPLRWIYYRVKKWHYYLLDFCYYANAIFVVMLLFFPNNPKLFLICFSFAEGPLAWALIVWRCSLVFSSIDKIISVLIHLLPGTVFFIIRWWDPRTFAHHLPEDTGPWPAWPLLESEQALWTWLFVVPLLAYSLWQMLYFFVVNVLRRQRLLRDPEVMTSFRELSRKASRANNIWWRISGVLGDRNRVGMYAVLQAIFTVATMALTVPMFRSYRVHILFECFKVAAAVWNGGIFFFDVMPRKIDAKKKRKFTPVSMDDKEIAQAYATSTGIPAETTAGHISVVQFEGTSGIVEDQEQQVCANCVRTQSGNVTDLLANHMKAEELIAVNGFRSTEVTPTKTLGMTKRKSSEVNGDYESLLPTLVNADQVTGVT